MRKGGPLKRTAIKRGTSELKRSPIARGESQLQRTELRRDPAYRIPQQSEKRKAQQVERSEVVRPEVLRLAGAARPDDLRACQYRRAVPEVACGWLPGRRVLEVDELRGGSYRSAEWLDPSRCRAVCPCHHDYKTTHKDDVLARLAQIEGGPPHGRR
ncbi:MAG TPA: hypothetical protein VJ140_14015 [Actinomycetota bacterium]|nr:hypothetical protein [Actinomycetota bacterium]